MAEVKEIIRVLSSEPARQLVVGGQALGFKCMHCSVAPRPAQLRSCTNENVGDIRRGSRGKAPCVSAPPKP